MMTSVPLAVNYAPLRNPAGEFTFIEEHETSGAVCADTPGQGQPLSSRGVTVTSLRTMSGGDCAIQVMS